MATTAWGKATVIETIVIEQDNDERAFATHIELLRDADGEPLVRFAYSMGGVGRRGPVTLRLSDIRKLRKALARSPGLRDTLGFGSE